jgi:hypothetical protein
VRQPTKHRYGMASSIPSKVLGTFNKAPSTFANSSSGLIPGIGKRQKHLFAPASYYYTFDNKDILPGLTKDQDKMIAQLVKDMGNVHKRMFPQPCSSLLLLQGHESKLTLFFPILDTTKAPIPGQMADKAFDLIYRTDHFALKQKFLQPDAAARRQRERDTRRSTLPSENERERERSN